MISNEALTKIVPIFVAAMILLIRVLIIGTFSIAGDRMFTTQNQQQAYNNNPRPVQQQIYRPTQQQQPILRPASSLNRPNTYSAQGQNTPRPAPKPVMQQTSFVRQEPTYHPFNGQANNDRSFDA